MCRQTCGHCLDPSGGELTVFLALLFFSSVGFFGAVIGSVQWGVVNDANRANRKLNDNLTYEHCLEPKMLKWDPTEGRQTFLVTVPRLNRTLWGYAPTEGHLTEPLHLSQNFRCFVYHSTPPVVLLTRFIIYDTTAWFLFVGVSVFTFVAFSIPLVQRCVGSPPHHVIAV